MVRFGEMLRQLTVADVRFVVIGGVAGIIHGSPRLTNDLDVCYDATSENLRRLIDVLRGWSPYPRGWPPELPFALDERTFRTTPLLTLRTQLGDFDLLDRVDPIGDYDAVRQVAVDVEAFGIILPTLDLPALIRVKRHVGRPKDREALHELEALLVLQTPRPAGGSPTP